MLAGLPQQSQGGSSSAAVSLVTTMAASSLGLDVSGAIPAATTTTYANVSQHAVSQSADSNRDQALAQQAIAPLFQVVSIQFHSFQILHYISYRSSHMDRWSILINLWWILIKSALFQIFKLGMNVIIFFSRFAQITSGYNQGEAGSSEATPLIVHGTQDAEQTVSSLSLALHHQAQATKRMPEEFEPDTTQQDSPYPNVVQGTINNIPRQLIISAWTWKSLIYFCDVILFCHA